VLGFLVLNNVTFIFGDGGREWPQVTLTEGESVNHSGLFDSKCKGAAIRTLLFLRNRRERVQEKNRGWKPSRENDVENLYL